jgi:phosphoribosylanthranilate isomerase
MPEIDTFTTAEQTTIGLLFDRLNKREVAPVVVYAITKDGQPVAAFNGMFTEHDREFLGGLIMHALEFVHLVHQK